MRKTWVSSIAVILRWAGMRLRSARRRHACRNALPVQVEPDGGVLLPGTDRELVDRDPPEAIEMIRRGAQRRDQRSPIDLLPRVPPDAEPCGNDLNTGGDPLPATPELAVVGVAASQCDLELEDKIIRGMGSPRIDGRRPPDVRHPCWPDSGTQPTGWGDRQ
jgi:hypothetical protein